MILCILYYLSRKEKEKAWHLMIALHSYKGDSYKPQQSRNENIHNDCMVSFRHHNHSTMELGFSLVFC